MSVDADGVIYADGAQVGSVLTTDNPEPSSVEAVLGGPRHASRIASGVLVLGFGLFGLYHAPTLGGDLWSGVVCVT